jgi:hypothetical protein
MKDNQANHIELRESYLSALAEALVVHRNPDIVRKGKQQIEKKKTKQIRALKRREYRKRMFQRIGNTLSVATDNRGGLVRVDIPEVANYQPYTQGPDPRVWEGSWRSVTDPNQVAK